MEKAYIVCVGTNGRAVIYGYSETEPVSGQPITLRRARMVLYWDSKCGGLLGLAAKGPKGGTRLTAAVACTGTDEVKQWFAVSASEEVDAWPAC